MDQKRNSTQYLLIKTVYVQKKERIMKVARGKCQVTYKGSPITTTADFSMETLKARRAWTDRCSADSKRP